MKTAEHIIETVDKLVRKYHTRDPYELCQLLGIKIHYYDLQKKLKGFFYYQSRQKNIVIDHNVNGILERILVAHELGHAVLHTKIAMMHGFQEMEVFDDRSIEENEAIGLKLLPSPTVQIICDYIGVLHCFISERS